MSLKNIGIFDSGIGGISVLKRAVEILKNESFIYYGDSKNAPYGDKCKDEIITSCINICKFLIYENNCKSIIVACNTASSAGINELRSIFEPEIPIIGIEPAIKPAYEVLSKKKSNKYFILLATPFTIYGDKLKNLMDKYKSFEYIKPIPLNLLAFMIESKDSRDNIYNYLYLNLKDHIGKIEGVILGCTHYYFIKDIIKDILGDNIFIFDGIDGTVNELKRRLNENNIINDDKFNDRRVYIYNSLSDNKVKDSYRLLEV